MYITIPYFTHFFKRGAGFPRFHKNILVILCKTPLASKTYPPRKEKKAGAYPAFIGALLDEGVKKTCRWQVFSPRVPARRTGARSANGESAPKGEVQQKKQDVCPASIGALLDEGVKKTCRWQVFSPRVPARRTGARSANGESAPKGEVQQKKQDVCPASIGALLDEGVKKTCRWQVFSPRVPARRTGARSANGESAPKGEVQQKKQDISSCFLLVHFQGLEPWAR